MELRFFANSDPMTWDQLLEAIFDWLPGLRPVAALRLADPDQITHPWSEVLRTIVTQACATPSKEAWLLTPQTGPRQAITIDVRRSEVRLSLLLPRREEGVVETTLLLIDRLHPILTPATLMVFDPDDPDDNELVLQGLSGLHHIPPILFLNEQVLEAIGGEAHLRESPCGLEEAPGGWLLVVRPDPWRRPNDLERLLHAAVERHLGVGTAPPLSWNPRSERR